MSTMQRSKTPKNPGLVEDELDEALDETFPASDPIAVTPEKDKAGKNSPEDKDRAKRPTGQADDEVL